MYKFRGTFDELRQALAACGIRGQWEEQPNGVFMLRCVCCFYGANLHWASGSKSVWCDGKAESKAELEKRLIAMLIERAMPEQHAA